MMELKNVRVVSDAENPRKKVDITLAIYEQ